MKDQKIDIATNDDSITLWWTPPFSLNVTDVDIDVWYTVLICNAIDKEDDCKKIDITQPNYTFHVDLSSCHNYTITVIPQNLVGSGRAAERGIIMQIRLCLVYIIIFYIRVSL